MDTFDTINPFTLTNTLNRITHIYEDENPSDTVEGLSSGATMGIFIQLLSTVISLYTGYIFARCYCEDFKSYAAASVMMGCCAPCFIPYLYFQRFVNKCGIGQIGQP